MSEAPVESSAIDLRLVVDSLPFPSWFANAAGAVVGANARWGAFTGQPVAAVLGSGWINALAPEERNRATAAFGAATAAGTTEIFVTRLIRHDNQIRWMRARLIPIRDAGGAIGQWLATWSDVDDEVRTAERLRVAAAANAALVRSTGLDATFAALDRLIVPALADWYSLHRVEDDGLLRIVHARHRDPERAGASATMSGTPMRVTQGNNYEAFRTGRPVLNVTTDLDRALANHIANGASPAFVDAVRSMGYRCGIALPLQHRGRIVGTLHVVRSEPGSGAYDARDIPLFTEIAATTAASIVQAQTYDALVASYEREHRVATVMQEGALPTTLPQVPGMQFDAYYAPARSEALIGGDWYDALQLRDGRIVLSIGDVVGSGLDAAVTMSNVRQVIRGVAHVHPNPMTLLDAADGTLRAERPDRIVTAFVAIYDPATRILTYASAGHSPPLLREPDGTLHELRADALPLGLRRPDEGAEQKVRIPPGSLLLLYTDGLVESTRDLLAGEARVRAALDDPAVRDVEHPARALHDAVLYDGSFDDVAILTVAITR
ncbi:hypothetical protein WPS_21410 [Vulcanimicrobium alpinum]|uniref:PAC domain-containing protein n=1 Tax=Vulcanimicrobium alpinum TaxID=3016050 RepID=A0AAN1XXR6_UNVUL|nr:SpoIIE family protein phosphatase [Vulcanimicrobium alpinum]BDE06865.1 hypothetical protein WPS_21410 [Vulcanimicrobium alpinum]